MLLAMTDSAPAPVTAVVGDEELLVERAVAEIVAAAKAGDPEVDVHDLTPGTFMPGDLIELTSPSLFGGGRVLVLRAAQDLGKDAAADIIAYVQDPAPDVTMVIVHAGGAKGKALLDAVKKAKIGIVSCPKITKASERVDFIRSEVRQAGRQITEDAARSLLDAVGGDLRELASACSQLASDTTGRIDDDTVARYHKGRAEATGFSVSDRAVEGRLSDALEQLRWALAVGTSPVLITSALSQGLRSLAKVGGAQERGIRGPGLARELGMPPWKVQRVERQLRGWTADGVSSALRVVAETDAQVKGGAADPAYALEHAVTQIVAARRA